MLGKELNNKFIFLAHLPEQMSSKNNLRYILFSSYE